MSENINDVLSTTKRWFEMAVPTPTKDNQKVQLGVHVEEFVEMLNEVCYVGATAAAQLTHSLGEHLKKDKIEPLMIKDRKALLDSLCDQIVTATGIAHMYGFDIIGALNNVNESNFSKFENGLPVFNESGKIKKGADYTAPELDPYVGTDPTI